jgi:hypothetical protein
MKKYFQDWWYGFVLASTGNLRILDRRIDSFECTIRVIFAKASEPLIPDRFVSAGQALPNETPRNSQQAPRVLA